MAACARSEGHAGAEAAGLTCDIANQGEQPSQSPANHGLVATMPQAVDALPDDPETLNGKRRFQATALSGLGFRVGPGEEMVDIAVEMAVDDLGKRVGEIDVRIDAVELAGLCRAPNYAEWFWEESVVCAGLLLVERSSSGFRSA